MGRALVAAAEEWARAQGYSEVASDALVENEASHRAHRALGFDEVERSVAFRKSLDASRTSAAATATDCLFCRIIAGAAPGDVRLPRRSVRGVHGHSAGESRAHARRPATPRRTSRRPRSDDGRANDAGRAVAGRGAATERRTLRGGQSLSRRWSGGDARDLSYAFACLSAVQGGRVWAAVRAGVFEAADEGGIGGGGEVDWSRGGVSCRRVARVGTARAGSFALPVDAFGVTDGPRRVAWRTTGAPRRSVGVHPIDTAASSTSVST